MVSTKPAATESNKRKRGFNVDDLEKRLETEPDDYKIAWDKLKHDIIDLDDHVRQTVPTVIFHLTCLLLV